MLKTESDHQLDALRETRHFSFDMRVHHDTGATQTKYPDPWPGTLAAIRQCSLPAREGWRASHRVRGTVASCAMNHDPSLGRFDLRPYSITIIERLADSTITIAWHDPTLCNYANQIWELVEARRAGRCAFSGKHIHRGASVYSPRPGKDGPPLNIAAMILASALPVIREEDN
jgi:hypothetical protein